jgi:predicted CopG family antitoxin
MDKESNITTITLRKSTKYHLAALKGEKDWDSFLEEIYQQKRKKEGISSLSKMRELLDEEDLNKILISSRKFRKEFKLR